MNSEMLASPMSEDRRLMNIDAKRNSKLKTTKFAEARVKNGSKLIPEDRKMTSTIALEKGLGNGI